MHVGYPRELMLVPIPFHIDWLGEVPWLVPGLNSRLCRSWNVTTGKIYSSMWLLEARTTYCVERYSFTGDKVPLTLMTFFIGVRTSLVPLCFLPSWKWTNDQRSIDECNALRGMRKFAFWWMVRHHVEFSITSAIKQTNWKSAESLSKTDAHWQRPDHQNIFLLWKLPHWQK